MKWFVFCVAILMYICVIAFQGRKVWFTSAAAILLVLAAFIWPGQIFRIEGITPTRMFGLTHSLGKLINWNVLMIYVGSMIIAALFLYSNVPSRIADGIVGCSRNAGIAIVLILAMTGIISIFVENVATVLVMAPIALALSEKLGIRPTHFLIGLAVMSNLEGTATLVGDPPSMIFASHANYSFNDFFIHDGKLSIFFFIQAGLVAGCIFFYFFFMKVKNKVQVSETPVISWFPAVLLILMIVGLAVISFLHVEFEYLSGIFVILLGTCGLIWYIMCQDKNGEETWNLVKELDWETIFFLMGIFVVVGAIQETGLLKDFAVFLGNVIGENVLLGFVIILVVSIVLSGFVDNVPYIIVMLPVIEEIVSAMNEVRVVPVQRELFMFALLIGSCLGGNLSPFGASANVVAVGIIKKQDICIKTSQWFKICIPFTIVTTLVASIFLWIVWA